MQILLFALLGICSVHDLRSRKIPAVLIWICIGVAAGYRAYMIMHGKSTIKECLLCMIPGIVLLFFSYAGRQVGDGDGWLVLASGLWLTWEKLVPALMYAFMAAGLFSAGYLLVTRREKTANIPFVPFLFGGILILVSGDIL